MVGWRTRAGVMLALASVAFLSVSGAARGGEPEPKVDRILVKKAAHTITLFAGDRALYETTVAIGPGGSGPKRKEGDSTTPVGRYHIVSKGPSKYRVFLGLDYPNADDKKRFALAVKEGNLPKNARIGGDVGIHGAPPQREWKSIHKSTDWTLGCVAVDDEEIDAIAKKVRVGTIVDIED